MPQLPRIPARRLVASAGVAAEQTAAAAGALGRLALRGARLVPTNLLAEPARRVRTVADVGATGLVAAAGAVTSAVAPHLPGAAGAPASPPHASAAPPAGPSPLPDLDRATPGMLRARLPRLGLDELATLRAQEQAGAARPQILGMLDDRLEKLRGSPQ